MTPNPYLLNAKSLTETTMEKLKTQFGESVTADFQESTWTFVMPKGFEMCAGKFAIIPKSEYDVLCKTKK